MNKNNKDVVTHATGGHPMRTNGASDTPEIVCPQPEPQKGFAKASPNFKPIEKTVPVSEEETKKVIASNTKKLEDDEDDFDTHMNAAKDSIKAIKDSRDERK